MFLATISKTNFYIPLNFIAVIRGQNNEHCFPYYQVNKIRRYK